MPQFEYTDDKFVESEIPQKLEEKGQQGWQMTGVHITESWNKEACYKFYFVRAK